MKTITKLWILIVILAMLAPLGLILPELFKAGPAWGEWGIEELRALIGYVPKGLEKFASIWKAPMSDYVTPSAAGYILSAIAGVVIISGIILFIGNFLSRPSLFLERSLKGALDFFKQAVFSEDIARAKGLLQLFDPRIKIILLLSSIFIICFVRNLSLLACLYFFSIGLAFVSGINIFFFIKRVWFFIPLFTLVIAIPAFFMQNAYSASIFIVRVATCVSFVVLIVVTTRQNELLKSLRSIGVPNIFVQILDMTYRYTFFFVKVFEEMHMALKGRTIRSLSASKARRWIGSRMGYMFKRSIKMSEDVYMAMVARGYTGEVKKYGK